MTGLSEVMVELHDRATSWLRDDRCQLLHILTTAGLRKDTLRALRALELSPHTPGPFVELDAPHDLGAPGWDVRANMLRRAYEARREQAERGEWEPWPELGPPPPEGGLAGFAEQLGAVLAATPAGRPWVVVLAPVFVKALPHWARAIAMLLRGSSLGSVRWVVVDVGRSSLGELGAGGEGLVRIDLEAGDGLAEDASAVAAEGASGAPGARSGTDAPIRRRQAVSGIDDPERELRLQLGKHVVGASSALREGDHAKAVEQQRRARDLCTEAGWTEQQISMELLLGSYLLAASMPGQAELSQRRAIEYARKAEERPDLLPLSQIALGSTRLSRGDRPAAMLAYSEAVVSAEPLGAAPLMLEACRLAGDTALLLGMDAQAIAFWGRAVTLAQRAPEVAGLGSAGHSARALALLCERRGFADRAAEYWNAARQLDGVDVQAIRESEPLPSPRVSTPTAPRVAQASEVAPSSKTLRLDEPSTAPRPVDEGTANISVEELAALHWQGVVPKPPPSEVVHRWSASEEDTIRHATSRILAANTTSLMTREEVLAIHGRAALPPARQVTAEATAMIERASIKKQLRATEPEAEGTAWIPPEQLAAIRARFGHPREAAEVLSPAPANVPTTDDDATIYGRAELTPPRKVAAMVERASTEKRPRATESEAERTAWIPSERLASIRASFAQPLEAAKGPVPAPSNVPTTDDDATPAAPSDRPTLASSPSDRTAVMTREQVLELARRYPRKRTPNDSEP